MIAPVRFSALKRIAQSPAHYRYHLEHPPEPTPAMRIGTVAHAVVLGAWRPYAIWSGGRRYGKEWDAFRAEHQGQDIYSAEEWAEGERIAAAVAADPVAAPLIARARWREQEVAFRIGSRRCGCRIDASGRGLVVELKTCREASPTRFPYQALRMGYYAQVAWQVDALDRRRRRRIREAYIIAVEQKPPHVVQVYEVTPASLDYGRRTYALWFERLLNCEASGEWPGYVQSVVPLEPPGEAGDIALSIGGEEIAV